MVLMTVDLAGVDPAAPVGTVVGAVVDGARMAVVHGADGWVMVPDACPHAICPFSRDGEVVDGGVLSCYCHGSAFDLRTGEVVGGPARRPLPLTRLVVEDGVLRVGGAARGHG